MKIPFGKPLLDVSERNAVMRVLKSDILTHGKNSILFEKRFQEFTKINYCTSVANCTAALHISYLLIGLKKGDEVILPSQTHVATAHSVEITGAKPVFVDSDDAHTGNINIDKIKKKINKRTKAICVVHFLGKPVDMSQISKLANKYKLFLIEDCALALGAKFKGKHVGTYGDFSAFSFYPAKHITTADGGMLGIKKKVFFDKAKKIKAFGVDKRFQERKVPGDYDVKYLGINYRLDELRSAMGICQLKKINYILNKRKKNYIFLKSKIENIKQIKILNSKSEKNKISSYYCLSFSLSGNLKKKRFQIINQLNKKGIGTSIYYPKILPEFTYYKKKYNYSSIEFKNAKVISDNSICLPIAPHVNKKNLIFIEKSLKEIIQIYS
tara:strand:- start:5509 stop:6657 length:1149 start_codon:yes stop_codon:yes gene_type:complete